MESLFANIDAIVSQQPALAFVAVFAAGIISAASPCVLAAIPLVIGYVGGYAGNNRKKAALYSGAFVIGLTLTFTLLGAAASAMGRVLAFLGDWIFLGLAMLAILMGLQFMGALNIPLPFSKTRTVKNRGLMGAFLLGLLTGTVSSPCATPVLAMVLALASTKGDIVYGSILLFVYAIGHCALIFIAGFSVAWTERMLASRGFKGVSTWSRRASGLILVLVGVYFGWNFTRYVVL